MSAITLNQYLLTRQVTSNSPQRISHLTADLTQLILQTAISCKGISAALHKGALAGVLGSANSDNVQGETQKKLDIISNVLMVDTLLGGGIAAALASEEMDEMIVAALRVLLPEELQFLISDRGVHFTAQVFKQLARNEEFIHVIIARHRPQSNGIAERFVRTLKEWLATHSWDNGQELLALLEQFRPEYNDRPHQGIGIPGLSPNEFAKRIWLL